MLCRDESVYGQVLDRSVVGDQFWFPDGWVAFDLGLYTSLQVCVSSTLNLKPQTLNAKP